MKPKHLISEASLNRFQQALGYHYQDMELLLAALAHPSSFRHEEAPFPFKIHFQRLEFLGDRCLSAVLARTLFDLFPDEREGFLSKAYMALAQGRSLVKLAENLNVESVLLVNTPKIMDSMLEDAMEAIIGSIWLDSCYEEAEQSVLRWFGDIKQRVLNDLTHLNSKGQLQEWVGEYMHDIHYEIVKIWGPEHRRKFCSAVYLKDRLLAQGTGASKREADENAAVLALNILKEESSNVSQGADA